MWRLNDIFGSTPVHPGELLSAAAFARLDRLRERSRRAVEADRIALNRFLDEHPQVSAPRLLHGTTAFVRLDGQPVEPFLERLRREYETSAVPGRYFEMPEYFRIGMGVDNAMFAEGLRRIGLALNTTASS
jgi:aspartate/methionine/tyrosine aminotransferase